MRSLFVAVTLGLCLGNITHSAEPTPLDGTWHYEHTNGAKKTIEVVGQEFKLTLQKEKDQPASLLILTAKEFQFTKDSMVYGVFERVYSKNGEDLYSGPAFAPFAFHYTVDGDQLHLTNVSLFRGDQVVHQMLVQYPLTRQVPDVAAERLPEPK